MKCGLAAKGHFQHKPHNKPFTFSTNNDTWDNERQKELINIGMEGKEYDVKAGEVIILPMYLTHSFKKCIDKTCPIDKRTPMCGLAGDTTSLGISVHAIRSVLRHLLGTQSINRRSSNEVLCFPSVGVLMLIQLASHIDIDDYIRKVIYAALPFAHRLLNHEEQVLSSLLPLMNTDLVQASSISIVTSLSPSPPSISSIGVTDSEHDRLTQDFACSKCRADIGNAYLQNATLITTTSLKWCMNCVDEAVKASAIRSEVIEDKSPKKAKRLRSSKDDKPSDKDVMDEKETDLNKVGKTGTYPQLQTLGQVNGLNVHFRFYTPDQWREHLAIATKIGESWYNSSTLTTSSPSVSDSSLMT